MEKRGGKLGHKVTPETREKISRGLKGKCIGENNHFYGKKHTQKTKNELKNIHIKIGAPWMIGKKHSEETKKKIGLIHKGKTISQATKDKWKLNRTGKNTGGWKGGITPLNMKIRNSFEGKLWRKACMERDNWTDQKTGIRGGNLTVHHINNFAEFPELRTSIENGITLSKESHKKFHKIYGRKNNTREQLLEFLTNPR